MMHLRIIQWIFLPLFFAQFYLDYVTATWPLSNSSTIQLLGLFPNKANATKAETIPSSVYSRAMFIATIMLSQQFNITIDGQLIGWQTAQTGGTQIGAISSACQVLSTANVVGIIGPSFSRETPIIADLAKTIGIPAVSYAATSPGLSDKNAFSAFHRTVPSDNTAALAITELFIKYNWTSCIIIYQNDDFGFGGVDAISNAFNKYGLTVSDTVLFDIATYKFRHNLKTTLFNSPSRIVIVWADTIYTPTIIQYGLENEVIGPQFLWILSISVPLNTFNKSYYSNLVGMLTIEPAVGGKVGASTNTTLLNAAYALWLQYEPETFPGTTQVNNYALFAFDAAWSLILSLQKLCSSPNNTSSSCLSLTNTTSCYDPHLLNSDSFFNTINSINFLGVSGRVEFNNQTTDRINGTYYIVQNVQPSANGATYTSVLQWSASSHWTASTQTNVIIWPGNSLVTPTGRPVLNGVILRIGVIISSAFTIRTDTTDAAENTKAILIGYAIDLIELLRIKMGFIPQIIIAPANQTYNEIVQAVVDNVYDIVVGDVTVTATRRLVVDFSSSIYDTSLRVITRPGTSVDVNLLSFMTPFAPRLWLVIMGVLFFASILFLLMERRTNNELKERSFITGSTMCLWFTFGTLVGYGAGFNAQTAAGRLLTFGLYTVSIILVASYTANLASDLTITKTQNTINGIADIKNGKVPYSRVGILVGTAVEDYYLHEISGGSRNYFPIYSEPEIYACLLNNTIDAAIHDTSSLEFATHAIYCNLTLVGADFEPSAYAIVMQKGWIYAESFDVNILALRESNDLDRLKIKWLSGGSCSTSSSTGGTPPFTVETLAGLFLTFGVISVLSLLLYAWFNRSTIKDYLQKLAQQKGWCTKKSGASEASSNSSPYEQSQIHPTEKVSSPTARF